MFLKIRPAVAAATVVVLKLRAGFPTQGQFFQPKGSISSFFGHTASWVGHPALSLKTATVAAATVGHIFKNIYIFVFKW